MLFPSNLDIKRLFCTSQNDLFKFILNNLLSVPLEIGQGTQDIWREMAVEVLLPRIRSSQVMWFQYLILAA